MGCDTHMYIEYKSKESTSWRSFGGRINPGRNYLMFGLMAKGVRTEPENGLDPKGFPDDAGFKSANDNRLYIAESEAEDHATLAAAQGWVNRGTSTFILHNGVPTWVTHPDWHSHSWLCAAEFREVLNNYGATPGYSSEPEYEAVLACMEKFESMGYESRIVFWFDN